MIKDFDSGVNRAALGESHGQGGIQNVREAALSCERGSLNWCLAIARLSSSLAMIASPLSSTSSRASVGAVGVGHVTGSSAPGT